MPGLDHDNCTYMGDLETLPLHQIPENTIHIDAIEFQRIFVETYFLKIRSNQLCPMPAKKR